MDLREAKQGERSIQEFYLYLTELWDQLALMDPTELAKDSTYQILREEHKLVELLMALRDNFENLRSSMLHRSPLPTVSIAVNELLAKETRLKSLRLMSHSGSSQVFTTGSQGLIHVSGKPKSKIVMDECAYCHEKGH